MQKMHDGGYLGAWGRRMSQHVLSGSRPPPMFCALPACNARPCPDQPCANSKKGRSLQPRGPHHCCRPPALLGCCCDGLPPPAALPPPPLPSRSFRAAAVAPAGTGSRSHRALHRGKRPETNTAGQTLHPLQCQAGTTHSHDRRPIAAASTTQRGSALQQAAVSACHTYQSLPCRLT